MGTFDILNMRINGYQFHVDLMAGQEGWDSRAGEGRLQAVGRAPPVLLAGRARAHVAGRRDAAREQAGRHVPARRLRRQQLQAGEPGRRRLLPVPLDQPEVGAGLDRRSDRRLHALEEAEEPRRREEARSATSEPRRRSTSTTRSTRATSRSTSTPNKSKYTPLQKKEAALIASTKHIAQYMDRDTRPDFASTVMIPSLQSFLNDPTNVNGLTQQHPEAEEGDLRIVSL